MFEDEIVGKSKEELINLNNRINEIIEKNNLSDSEMIVILNDYKEIMEFEGYGVEDYLFYEEVDIEVLKRLGFVELIG